MHSIVGRLHNKPDRFEIEPMVIGAPWFDHPRNGKDSGRLMWLGYSYGEILPEEIEEFSKMSDVKVKNKDEWMSVVNALQEKEVKEAFANLLSEPTKKDWAANRTITSRRMLR